VVKIKAHTDSLWSRLGQKTVAEKWRPTPSTDLLSPDDLASLSNNARRLYTCVWNWMSRLDRSQVFLQNQDIVKRLNIAVPTVIAAQYELTQAGLLEIRQGSDRGSEALRCVSYTFPAELTT